MSASIATSQTILVVGGGISGMTAALEAAECGQQVILAEKLPTLGGAFASRSRRQPRYCRSTWFSWPRCFISRVESTILSPFSCSRR